MHSNRSSDGRPRGCLRPARVALTRPRRWLAALAPALAALALATGCAPAPSDRAADDPAAEVLLLAEHLRNNDLEAYLGVALPPDLRPGLTRAWREGRSRWPLDELPLDDELPALLATLSEDGAERRLRRDFDRQFSGAHGEIRSAARTLGLFGEKYIASDASLVPEEREHYAQLIRALSAWGQQARLGDPQRARRAIAQLTAAARRTGLRSEADFARLGPEESLRRLGPFLGTFKQALGEYGLDLDDSLDALTATVERREGDRVWVRLRYPLADARVDTLVSLERVQGRWYLASYLRHAREAAAAPQPGLPAPPAPTPALPAPPAGESLDKASDKTGDKAAPTTSPAAGAAMVSPHQPQPPSPRMTAATSS